MNLAELITDARGDRSYERLAKDSGNVVTRSTLHRLATEPHRNPADPPTIRALSVALRRKLRTVWLAQGESLGLEVWQTGDDLEAKTVDGLDLLTAEDWNLTNALLTYLVDRRRQERTDAT